jgi:hypothetical protein
MDKTERLTMDVATAGAKLGLSRNAAYAAATAKQIPTIRVGGRILVPIAAFERFLNGQPAA